VSASAFDVALILTRVATVLTLVMIVVYLVLGVDDLFHDVYFWIRAIVRSIQYRGATKLTLEKLDALDEKRIALFVPCWHEADVVSKMVTLVRQSLRYGNYDIFVGVYPNDPRTQEAVDAVIARFPNVHKVVNPLDGPTTKAQNLNSIYAGMKAAEGTRPFDIVVLHDVEDIVHPLSFKLFNYLIPHKDMVQLPVFPLERPGFNWTAWTYADEFAENHQKDLLVREALNGFVPGAGVGCAYGRICLEVMRARSGGDLFRPEALTEDYQFGLDLKLNGFKTIFVHQRIEIPKALGWRFSPAGNFVATRAYFPFDLRSATRQKARWVAGICFQAAAVIGWKGNLMTRYDLYRDRKSVISDFASLFGYVVLALVGALYLWRWYDPAVPVPRFSDPLIVVGLWLALGVTIARLCERAIFVGRIYGFRQAVFSVFRTIWGNVINGVASLLAVAHVIQAAVRREPLTWTKTRHHFPDDVELEPYRRELGELLPHDDIEVPAAASAVPVGTARDKKAS
jgi:bacteriophage N4 adsorption protein B